MNGYIWVMKHAPSIPILMHVFMARTRRRMAAQFMLDRDDRKKLSRLNKFKKNICQQNGINPNRMKIYVEDVPGLPIAGIRYGRTCNVITFVPEAVQQADSDILNFTVAHEVGHVILRRYYTAPPSDKLVVHPDSIATLKGVRASLADLPELLQNTKDYAVILKHEELAVDAIAVTLFPTVEEGLRALQKSMPFFQKLLTLRTPEKDKVPRCYRSHPKLRTRARLAQRTFGPK